MAKKIISVINHKGGVGKTTTAVNLGVALRRLGKKVLLVDMDPQANLTIHLDFPIEGEKNIYGALRKEYDLPIMTYGDGIDIVPSTLDLSAIEVELTNEPGRENFLKFLLKPVADKYDYILIDCPPSLGLLTINALSASQEMIITIEPGKFAVVGMGKLFEIVNKVKDRINPDLDHFNILLTKVDLRKSLHKDVVDSLRKNYPGQVFKTQIKTNVSIEYAQINGISVFEQDEKSSGAEDYLSLGKEIIKTKK